MKDIDVRKLACPGPVLALKNLLETGEQEIRLLVADDLARSNVSRFATTRGADVTASPHSDGGFLITVRAGSQSTEAHSGEEEFLVCDVPEEGAKGRGPTIVQITNVVMGSGDDELGSLLLRSFLKTQAQLDKLPDKIIFYNDGVKLCCEGSLLVQDLRNLEENKVEIIACGTCLNFFGLAESLAVGRGTDMLEIAGLLAEAGHIVQP
ncbi:MAG: sulfurtransferase-like selenium metabolism protein YedF [Thermoanaerobaculales bacterium]|nr:sulfurtransferase-like selenium metabolism protein YedF [Thermoanaerobaculales bacterium]